MKKLLVLAAVIVAGIAANAASFKWSAANIYAADGTSKYAGDVVLYATIDGVATEVSKFTTTAGAVSANTSTFSSDLLVAGTTYDFFFTVEDNGKIFTSTVKSASASDVGTTSIGFGNMASATQNASNWAAVPEPTSGLLMLLGVAGLALKRKRA